MNKKLLFGIMSLAALTACTNDDFESQNVAQEASPIQFEVLNNDAATRASMDGNKIVWSANDGDIFTLYNGGAGITGFENAIYKANASDGGTATLTTPSMIKAGLAVMVWPADTTFRIRTADNLSIVIPADQKADIENYIPYMSDQITIGAYAPYTETGVAPSAYNTEGYYRKYPVFMRPMASQLTVNADYAGTDARIAQLYEGGSDGLTGDDAIEPIEVTSVELSTLLGGADEFTTDLDVKWTAPTAAINSQWNGVAHNAWTAVTDFDLGAINATTDKLTTLCLTGNSSSKFLLLPQAAIAGGVDDGAVVVNTLYGKVVVAAPGVAGSMYTAGEAADAWYRFISAATKTAGAGNPGGYELYEAVAATAGADGKFKTTSAIADGMMQTINVLSTYTHQAAGVVKGEPEGAAATRYVKVLLTHLDMSDLHIKTDKQLRDAARVWKKLGLAPVTVLLDGAAGGKFEISQKTIEVINSLNTRTGANLNFTAKPCQVAGEQCTKIVIKGSNYKQAIQNIDFIVDNAGNKVDVELKNEGTATPWKWNGDVKVLETAVNKIINRGTMENAATATLKTIKNTGASTTTQNNVPFENANNATWNIKSPATVNVQFDVTNNGTVNIEKGAQYRQDGRQNGVDALTTFTNDATRKPTRFGGNDAFIGKIINKGVFATVAAGEIYNYGLIEHADVDAKTYVTTNQTAGADFTQAFAAGANMMGRINLPYSNKDEDNVSITAALNQGFVSVTVDGEVTGALDASVVGPRVNYVIVKSGITSIANLPTPQIKYLEINMDDKSEIAWSVTGVKNFDGLMVLTDVNIKLNTTINADVTYLGSDMYVGGIFNNGTTDWNGYYGNTASKVATNYITY